jgi:hypothetical protein
METAKQNEFVNIGDTAFNMQRDPKVCLVTEEGQEEITTIKKKKQLKFDQNKFDKKK